ncbi:Ldh family oxidoreductase [Aliirhizobium smilacinae]|uniref:Ldh family oxidoreductase n=1 Tax=Aliirhizobium smilacinae TaxID=1395944 RepID=A0A5C4XPK5_9HYPH|nr:Ldh family oxidoreductase [Rhizobium smilacinae]TNM65343.1 Ldh family oxidoreductase [Rhizobium smilacinae]
MSTDPPPHEHDRSCLDTVIEAPILVSFIEEILSACGLTASDARCCGEWLADADLRGVSSHGVLRLPMYVDCYRRGILNPKPDMEITQNANAVVTIDADDAIGLIAGTTAIDTAISLAEQFGIGAVFVRRSSHFGTASHYVRRAAERNFAAICTSNASPSMIAWGGLHPVLGTNPFAAAAPGGARYPAFVLDMSTSVVARGKIVAAAESGDPIPEGWATDFAGNATTDAARALNGALLPFAGAKGSGLAMFVDVLSGVVSGAAFASQIKSVANSGSEPVDVGHFFCAIDVEKLMPLSQYRSRFDNFVDIMKGSGEGRDVLIPGERSDASRRDRLQNGIPLRAATVQELDKIADLIGVSRLVTEPTH